jgi:hypothetical protein
MEYDQKSQDEYRVYIPSRCYISLCQVMRGKPYGDGPHTIYFTP